MTNGTHNAPPRVRCLSCGQVDAPTRVGPGPGWLAAGLWLLAAAFWAAAWYLPLLNWGFWATLLAALIYTLWYFAKREEACRHCGARTVEPHAGAAG